MKGPTRQSTRLSTPITTERRILGSVGIGDWGIIWYGSTSADIISAEHSHQVRTLTRQAGDLQPRSTTEINGRGLSLPRSDRRAFRPHFSFPCHALQNRQEAVSAITPHIGGAILPVSDTCCTVKAAPAAVRLRLEKRSRHSLGARRRNDCMERGTATAMESIGMRMAGGCRIYVIQHFLEDWVRSDPGDFFLTPAVHIPLPTSPPHPMQGPKPRHPVSSTMRSARNPSWHCLPHNPAVAARER